MRSRSSQGTTRREWVGVLLFLLALVVGARAASIEFVGAMGGGGSGSTIETAVDSGAAATTNELRLMAGSGVSLSTSIAGMSRTVTITASSFSGNMNDTTNKVLSNSGTASGTNGTVVVRDNDGLRVDNAGATNQVTITASGTNTLTIEGNLTLPAAKTFTVDRITGSSGRVSVRETAGFEILIDGGTGGGLFTAGSNALTLNVDGTGAFIVSADDILSVNAITGNGAGIELRESTGVLISDDAGLNGSLFTAASSSLTLNVNGSGAFSISAGDELRSDTVQSTTDNTTISIAGRGTGGVSIGTERFSFANLDGAAGVDTDGDIPVRIGKYLRLGVGASNTFLASNGTTPAYRLLLSTDIDELIASSDLTDFSSAKSGTGASVVSNVGPTIQDLTLSTFVSLTDQAGSPGTAGRLQRSGANVEFHDGTAARVLEKQSNKGAANGYASLDGSTKVPSAQISEVLGLADLTNFGAGNEGEIVYRDGSGWTVLGDGAASTVLVTDADGTGRSQALIVNANIDAAAAVAISKLANINTDVVLGRDTAAAGAIEELALGGTAQALGTAAANGTASAVARSDHAHPAPSVRINDDAHGATTALWLAGPFRSATSSGTTNVTLTDVFEKNAIINGEFAVAQRGTSFAAIANGAYSLDRLQYAVVGAAVHTISQSSDIPTVAQAGRLTQFSALVVCTTSDASIAAGDRTHVVQPIEGYRWARLAQRACVLSFWVKATKTGTYCVSIRNSGTDRSCVVEYAVNSADTWEYKQCAFPASPSAGTWNYTTGVGAYVAWTLASGSTFQTTAGSYQTGNFIATSNQVNATDSTSNNFRIAMVQLETGAVATEYESRNFGPELLACRRYYEELGGLVTNEMFGSGHAASTTGGKIQVFWTAVKRAAPAVTISAAGDFTVQSGASSTTCSALSFTNVTLRNTFVDTTHGSLGAAGDGLVLFANTTNCRIKLDAEL